MSLLDPSSIPPIEQAHPGGFFLSLDRSRRIQAILSLASKLKGIVVIAGSEGEAEVISERLTLRGVPVLLASNPQDAEVISESDSDTTALVTTARFIEENGPVHAPLTVHLRPPFSPRSYAKRLRCSVSAVHVTFVTPEDQQRAGQLCLALSANSDVDRAAANDLSDLIDLSKSGPAAQVDQPKRRFTFRSR